MPTTRPTVLLGMSGGVDSSVAAALLVEQGFHVDGITLQVWEPEDPAAPVSKRWQERGCCKVGLARYVAKRLGISHELVDSRELFKQGVIDDFVAGYLGGTTPNPCVRCNERVKIRGLYALATARGADFVATGHYARVLDTDTGPALYRASDLRKDQSYFLYRVNPHWLPRILFPLGNMMKADVWCRAEELGLPEDEFKESQEICFVSHGDYRTFLAAQAPEARRPGHIVDTAGNMLGTHEGAAFYTPGQRRGLGIAAGHRLYVHRVDASTNTVVLGPEETLRQTACTVGELNLFDHRLLGGAIEASVKIRYATAAASARLAPLATGDIDVTFHQPQWALSPGQSAVFYDGDRVMGGGIIRTPQPAEHERIH